MIIDSVKMDLRLPGKRSKHQPGAQKLLSVSNPSAHSLSELIGKLNTIIPALQLAPLFSHSLQHTWNKLWQHTYRTTGPLFSYLPIGIRRPPMVRIPLIHMETQKLGCEASLHDNNFGCFNSRLESYLQWSMDSRVETGSASLTWMTHWPR